MAKEYIEREALLSLETIMVDPEGFEHSCVLSVDVRSAPAADVVEVVHGQWIETTRSNGWVEYDDLTCSVCGETFENVRWPNKWKGCPACLARMDGGDDA